MSKEEWASIPKEAQFFNKNPPKARVDKTLVDDQELPYCGGIRVIFTPGHSPGHISLYLRQSKILVSGDAMVCKDGYLRGPIQQTTPDMNTALSSVGKFLALDIESVICYHGGICIDIVKDQIRNLVGKVGTTEKK